MNFLAPDPVYLPGDEEGVYRNFGGCPPVATIVSAVTNPDSNIRYKILCQWISKRIFLIRVYFSMIGERRGRISYLPGQMTCN